MKHDLILMIIYAVMFLCLANLALVTNNVACDILAAAWGFGLLVIASGYRKH